MKLLNVIFISLIAGVCYANEEKTEETAPVAQDPLDYVMVCPQHSVHKGDEVPKWATTIDAIAFFCNDSKETEIAE